MINLSKRLKEIANYIHEEDNILDVGCDHALLDIYLSNKYSKVVYASDLRESALDMARINIKKYNADKVILKCGNGIEPLKECSGVNTIIISGMGYMSIINILRNINHTNIEKLVIQSNSNPEKVRKFILKKGFYIEDESVVLDRNIYYIVTSYKKGKKKYSKFEKEIGIITGKDLEKYIDMEIKKNNILLSVVPKSYFFKRIEIKRKLNYLNKKKNSIIKY